MILSVFHGKFLLPKEIYAMITESLLKANERKEVLFMEFSISLALGMIAGITLTILLYIKVLPKKMDSTFTNNFFQFLFDFFHFKKLYLEEVLKFIFTLATVLCVTMGAFMLISYVGYSRYRESLAPWGICLLIGGPVSLRLVYEGVMMFILLVKNTMEINNKLKDPKAAAPEAPAPEMQIPVANSIPVAPQAPAQPYYPNNNNNNFPPV